jgi:hypothetical protein
MVVERRGVRYRHTREAKRLCAPAGSLRGWKLATGDRKLIDQLGARECLEL